MNQGKSPAKGGRKPSKSPAKGKGKSPAKGKKSSSPAKGGKK